MKKLRNIFCMMVIICSSVFLFACKDNPPPTDVNVSFEDLKTVVAESEEIADWQGLNIVTLNASKEPIARFKSTKQVARTSDTVVDFIYEKGNHKVYCDNNVSKLY